MHTLIVGRTMSGKTTFAKKKCAAFKAEGIQCLVLDPICDTEWNADFITDNPDEFLNLVFECRSCAVFVDEAYQFLGIGDKQMHALALKGRHYGHKIYIISQRGNQIAPSVRAQCSDLVIFKQSLADTKDLANEYVEPLINEAHLLDDGAYIYVKKGYATEKYNVFLDS